jgi:hypothetical protein
MFLGYLGAALLAGVLIGSLLLLMALFGAGCWLTGVLVGREGLKARAWGPGRNVIDSARAAAHWALTPGSSEND